MKYIILIFLVIITMTIVGCTNKEKVGLTELQITACESADEGGSCDTKLEELGIITKEECCEILGKCC